MKKFRQYVLKSVTCSYAMELVICRKFGARAFNFENDKSPTILEGHAKQHKQKAKRTALSQPLRLISMSEITLKVCKIIITEILLRICKKVRKNMYYSLSIVLLIKSIHFTSLKYRLYNFS